MTQTNSPWVTALAVAAWETNMGTNMIENTYPRGNTSLSVVTRKVPEDRFLGGALHFRRGWHYHWSAEGPDMHPLVGVTRGPFTSEAAALAAAKQERPTW